eukprot:s668_g19.t1
MHHAFMHSCIHSLTHSFMPVKFSFRLALFLAKLRTHFTDRCYLHLLAFWCPWGSMHFLRPLQAQSHGLEGCQNVRF